MILVDSSVWIDFWNNGRGASSDQLTDLIEQNQAAINGFIFCELLKGAHGLKERRFILESLSALVWLEFNDADFKLADAFSWQLKQRGVNVTLIDGCLAYHAIKTKSLLFSKDKVFRQIAKNSDLKLAK